MTEKAIAQKVNYLFDANNQLRFVVDNSGYVVEKEYDGLGNVISERRYQMPLIVRENITVATLTSQLSASESRTQESYFDAVGRIRFSIDSAGFITEYQYPTQSATVTLAHDINMSELGLDLAAFVQTHFELTTL